MSAQPTVSQRDHAILRHIERYRITTREALHRTLFPRVAINSVTKVTSRLLAEGWLNQYPVFYKSFYFTLTPRAAELLGTADTARTEALTTEALRTAYGMLAFCCLSKTPRCRLLTLEVREDHPQFYFPNLDSDRYYLDATQRPKTCGIMFIDNGGAAEQMVAGYRDDLRARCSRPGFREFLATGQFCLAVVTATAERAAAIGKCLKLQDWPRRLRTAIELAPKLTYCLPKDQDDAP